MTAGGAPGRRLMDCAPPCKAASEAPSLPRLGAASIAAEGGCCTRSDSIARASTRVPKSGSAPDTGLSAHAVAALLGHSDAGLCLAVSAEKATPAVCGGLLAKAPTGFEPVRRVVTAEAVDFLSHKESTSFLSVGDVGRVRPLSPVEPFTRAARVKVDVGFADSDDHIAAQRSLRDATRAAPRTEAALSAGAASVCPVSAAGWRDVVPVTSPASALFRNDTA